MGEGRRRVPRREPTLTGSDPVATLGSSAGRTQSNVDPVGRNSCGECPAPSGRGPTADAADAAPSVSQDVHHAPTATLAELHETVSGRKQGVIPTPGHVLTRVESGSPLTNENRTSGDRLSIKALHTETLGAGVPPITR